MDVRNALARRPRHDRYAGAQQIITGHLEVSRTAAEQARELFLEPAIDVVIGILETRARFLVDPGYCVLERFQRSRHIGMLLINIFLALLLFLVFVDCGKIDRSKTRDALFDSGYLLAPVRTAGIRFQGCKQHLSLMSRFLQLLDRCLAAHAQLLAVQFHLLQLRANVLA